MLPLYEYDKNYLTFTVLIFGQIHCSKNVMFTVLSFGQVTKVFGLFYSVMFTDLIWSSFFGHLNNPPLKYYQQNTEETFPV